MILKALFVALLAAATAAQEQVALRQLTPSVAVRVGADRSERVLYYFSPTASLAQGDEFEQGGGAHSAVQFAEGSHAEFWASTHVHLDRIDPEGDVLRMPIVTMGLFESKTRPMVLVLPGGVRAAFTGTIVDVRTEPGRMQVRNRGEEPIQLTGFLSVDRLPEGPGGEGVLVLGRGQEANLPLFRITPPLPGRIIENWSELQLRHDGAFRVEPGSESVVLRPSDEGGWNPREVISVAGVHTRLDADRTLLVRNERLDVLEPLRDLEDPTVAATPTADDGSKIMTVELYLQSIEAGFSLEDVRLMGYIVPRSVIDEAERILNTPGAESPAENPQEQDG